MTEKICKKCILEKIDPLGVLNSVRERVSLLSDDEKVSDEVYVSRLEICSKCDKLSLGTCAECGCFVEYRAAKNDLKCPINRWA